MVLRLANSLNGDSLQRNNVDIVVAVVAMHRYTNPLCNALLLLPFWLARSGRNVAVAGGFSSKSKGIRALRPVDV